MAGKPRTKIAIPVFRSESDEAEWWASPKGRKYLADQFDRGAKLGTLRVGTPTNVAQLIRPAPPSSLSVAVSLRIPQSDVDKAKAVARRKGMAYQTYLKMLVHEALAREVV